MPPQIDIAQTIAHAIDPVLWARERLRFEADPWQERLLRSTAPQVILNCGRQCGKSTAIAILACHTAVFTDGALVLLIAPSQRQSIELARKAMDCLMELEPVEELAEDNKTSLTLSRNASRIVALPGHDPKNIRGFSSPRWIIVDEAAFTADATYAALLPMLAASPDGRLALLSTPNLNLGFFYDAWHAPTGWERFEVKTSDCPRVRPEWLEERKRENPLTFRREYCCEFAAGDDGYFPDALLDGCVSFDFEKLTL